MAYIWRYFYNCLLLNTLGAVAGGMRELPDVLYCCGQGTKVRMELHCSGDSGSFLVQIKTVHFQGSFIRLTTLYKTDASKLEQKYEVILEGNESREVTASTPYFHDRGLYHPEIELLDCDESIFQMCAENYIQGSSVAMNCKIYTWCKAESIINSSPAATLNDMGCFPRWTAGNSMDDLKGEDDADKKQLRKLYILLYNPDDPDHAEAVEILVSLFASVGLEALGHGTCHKFTQWLDEAEMALSEEVSDFVVIISKQLQSLCHQYITHESKETFEKLLTERNMEYLPCVVLKHLRHRYISPYLPSFRIHKMSLGFANSDVIRDFINDHKSFVKSDELFYEEHVHLLCSMYDQ